LPSVAGEGRSGAASAALVFALELRLAFEAAQRLDPEHQAHLTATLEGLLLRTETHRWQKDAS